MPTLVIDILLWIAAILGALLTIFVFVIFAAFVMIMIANTDKEIMDLDYDFDN